jgi:hypothetical protein
MNERIRELADEAAKYSATMFLPTGENGDELFIEKFAELIVQECIDTVLDSSVEYTTRPRIAEELKEHFGVEE